MRDASLRLTHPATLKSLERNRIALGGPWLMALILACAAIVIADGSSRPFFPDDEIAGESLQYEVYPAVYLFAFVSLPLCLVYAASKNTSQSEGLLLWFVLCTTAYTKDFAYIRLPGIPLFVTDLVLLILAIANFRRAPWRKWLGLSYFKILITFWCAGAVAFISAVRAGEELLRSVRDAAMVIYTLFLILGFVLIRNWESVRRVLLFLALGTALGAVDATAWFLAQPGQRRYVMFGVYALCALVGTVILWANRLMPARYGFPLVVVFSAGLLLANARTTYVALAALLAAVFAFGVSGQKGNLLVRARLVAQVSVLITLLLVVGIQTRVGAAFIDRAAEELISGTVTYADDPNVQFRLLAWAEAIDRFTADPIFGEGFGVPFTFAIWDEDVRPHNTYLTILYKMGVIGFLPFIYLLARLHFLGWRAVRRAENRSGAIVLYAILIAHAGMCLYGGLNLLLESPFLAATFWILMGLGIRSLQLLAGERITSAAANSGALTTRA